MLAGYKTDRLKDPSRWLQDRWIEGLITPAPDALEPLRQSDLEWDRQEYTTMYQGQFSWAKYENTTMFQGLIQLGQIGYHYHVLGTD